MEKPLHKIAIGVATMVIGTTILRFTTGFTFTGALRWIGRAFDACWNFAVAPVEVWTWLLIVLVLLSSILICVVAYRIYQSVRQPSSSDYTKDVFDGLVWRWHYGYGGGVRDAWCYCPQCDGVLSYSLKHVSSIHDIGCRWATDLFCDHCNRRVSTLDGDQDSIVHRIQRLIDRKIRVGEWREVVERDKPKS